ncbi:MAG: hypothetical protein QXS93_03590 [Candidatus Micrarchaeia archaeon]
MLSETLYKRMMLDKEFISSMTKAYIAGRDDNCSSAAGDCISLTEKNIALHKYHRSAFELALLFSPRASRTPSFIGDFLLTIASIAKLGKTYISNFRWLISISDFKKSRVKRLDKVNISLSQMQEMLETLEADVQSSIKDYISSQEVPDRQKISYYSKSLLHIRRSYFRIQKKLEMLEEHLNFSGGAYKPYEPLVMLAYSHQGQRGRKSQQATPSFLSELTGWLERSNPSQYLEAVYAYDTICSRQKRKDSLDIARTAFIFNYKLPRDAVLKHVDAIRNFSPELIYAESDTTRLVDTRQKPRLLPANSGK